MFSLPSCPVSSASRRGRYGVYIFSLICSSLVFSWAIMDLAMSDNAIGSKIVGMASAATVVAILSMACMIILIIFNNRQNSGHFFSRISTHFYALLIILVAMIAIGIPLLTQIPHQCNPNRKSKKSNPSTLWCSWICVTAAYALVVALFSGLIAIFIRRKAHNLKLDMKENIACLDGKVWEKDTSSSISGEIIDGAA